MGLPKWLRRVWQSVEFAHTAVWLFGIFGLAAIMTYLASITDWINAYGPLAWGGIGVATFVALTFGLYLYGRYQANSAHADYVNRKAQASTTNVLNPIHENERINLVDFYHPFYRSTENARFENCDLMGPAWINCDGCQFLNDTFFECEIVIVRPDRPVRGANRFKFCTFTRSNFYRVTFLMNHVSYLQFPEDFRAGIPVISDGRIGDI